MKSKEKLITHKRRSLSSSMEQVNEGVRYVQDYYEPFE